MELEQEQPEMQQNLPPVDETESTISTQQEPQEVRRSVRARTQPDRYGTWVYSDS